MPVFLVLVVLGGLALALGGVAIWRADDLADADRAAVEINPLRRLGGSGPYDAATMRGLSLLVVGLGGVALLLGLVW